MANTLAREGARVRHMTPGSMEDYARDLGQQAAALDPTDLEFARIALDAGITPEQAREDAKSRPSISPLAEAMEILVTRDALVAVP